MKSHDIGPFYNLALTHATGCADGSTGRNPDLGAATKCRKVTEGADKAKLIHTSLFHPGGA